MRCFQVGSPVRVGPVLAGKAVPGRHWGPQTVSHVAIVIPPLPLLCGGGGGSLLMPEGGQSCCSL